MPRLSNWLPRLTAAATLALLLALGWQCIDVYRDGSAAVHESGVLLGDIYSAEIVKARLEPFLLPALLYAALVLLTAAISPAGRKQPGGPSGRRRSHSMKALAASRSGRRCPEGALRLTLYLLAAALIVSGVLNGGLRDVLVKAINICTECIGLG